MQNAANAGAQALLPRRGAASATSAPRRCSCWRPIVVVRAKAPWESGDQAPRVSGEEAVGLSAEQLAFLDRKRRGIMPQGSVCGVCSGTGILVCHQCGGSGINAHQVDEELFDGNVQQQNGLLNVQPLFRKDWPCWLCRGRCEIGCPDCSGAGFKGINELYTGD